MKLLRPTGYSTREASAFLAKLAAAREREQAIRERLERGFERRAA